MGSGPQLIETTALLSYTFMAGTVNLETAYRIVNPLLLLLAFVSLGRESDKDWRNYILVMWLLGLFTDNHRLCLYIVPSLMVYAADTIYRIKYLKYLIIPILFVWCYFDFSFFIQGMYIEMRDFRALDPECFLDIVSK
jgi:hypothetical protein